VTVAEWKTIGILGGMGPEATAEFYKRIIGICQRDFGAKYDSDFPYIFICNLPLPDIVEEKGDPSLIKSVISDGLEKLAKAGCGIVAIPCNTVFAYIDKETGLEILDIIEMTEDFIRARKFKKIGLIATRNTIKNKLYENALGEIEILQLPENSQIEVNDVIMRILSGVKISADKERLQNFAQDLAGRGAEAVILGCTELPLLISQADSEILLVDTIQVLAEKTVRRARAGSI